MRKILLFLVTTFFALGMVEAKSVDVIQAQKLGLKFAQSNKAFSERSISSAQLSYTVNSTDGEPVIYIFNFNTGGFVLVSAEDCVKPILAFSNENTFDPNNISDGFKVFVDLYQQDIEYVRNNNVVQSADITKEWELLSSTGAVKDVKTTRNVSPLLESVWNQGKYYNDQCPEDPEGPNGHVYAGCVATAMSMVMKYWNYPETGQGSHSYSPGGWGYPSYPTQIANFGETDYHFELMPNHLDSTSTAEEIFYIAQLQHHAGISVEMMYSPDGSGAYSFYVPSAMSNNFLYSSDMELLDMDYYYTNETWAEMLKSELELHHPIYYSAQDDSGLGGHAFCCDGFDENDYFHFNWGWDGKDNGYFAIGALNTTRYAFNSSVSAIQGCVPANGTFYQRPDKVTDLTLEEIDLNGNVRISWVNPTLTVGGETLTTIDSVFVRRNFEVVQVLTDIQPGQALSITDEVPEYKVHEYSVVVKNSAGLSKPVYTSLLIGPKCPLVFNLLDNGGNGWNGACISVVDSHENRIAIITMEDGASETRTVGLLNDNLKFIYNQGWFTGADDDEISFSVTDLEGNEIYVSEDSLISGQIFTYDNQCPLPLLCKRPENLQAEYQWNNSASMGAFLSWDLSADDLINFNVYRSTDNEEYELITTVAADGQGSYEYFDEVESTTYYYKVRAFYQNETESCESEAAITPEGDDYVVVMVTSANENHDSAIRVYPNPTDGKITIEMEGMNGVVVYNILDQIVASFSADNDVKTFELQGIPNGFYFIRIQTKNGFVTKKIMLSK